MVLLFYGCKHKLFYDSLTIDAPSLLTGTQGSILFDLNLEGNLTGTTNAYITARVIDGAVDNAGARALNQQYIKLQDSQSLAVNSDLQSAPIYFTYGEPFDFSLKLISQASAAGPGWATSDFSSTMRLTDFEIYSGQNRITDFTAISGSGTVYHPQTVPEPSTMLLLGLGLLGVLGVRRKMQK